MPQSTSFVRWFSDVGLADLPLVGGKNASLGELTRALGAAPVRVPNGFAITADAYRHCHAAIVSRELGVPAIVGTETGTSLLQTGQTVTVSCASTGVPAGSPRITPRSAAACESTPTRQRSRRPGAASSTWSHDDAPQPRYSDGRTSRFIGH